MPEHVHLLLTPMRDPNGDIFCLVDILKRIKGASARRVNQLLGSCGPLWQEESFDHVIRNEESVRQKTAHPAKSGQKRTGKDFPEEYPWLWVEQV